MVREKTALCFLRLVRSAIKIKPEDKLEIYVGVGERGRGAGGLRATNISATALAAGCYYAAQEAG